MMLILLGRITDFQSLRRSISSNLEFPADVRGLCQCHADTRLLNLPGRVFVTHEGTGIIVHIFPKEI